MSPNKLINTNGLHVGMAFLPGTKTRGSRNLGEWDRCYSFLLFSGKLCLALKVY